MKKNIDIYQDFKLVKIYEVCETYDIPHLSALDED